MQDPKQCSPKILKKQINIQSPLMLNKQKSYLPSRYAHDITPTKNGLQDMLNSIEITVKKDEDKVMVSNSSVRLFKIKEKISQGKRKEASEFKPRPLKREESDYQNFKEIFLQPRLQMMDQIKLKSKSDEITYARQVSREYQKLLQFQKGQPMPPEKNEEMGDNQLYESLNECIDLLKKQNQDVGVSRQGGFYQQQIRIQPPHMPNASVASPLSPGSGYAPSIPLSVATNNKKGNITELLMRVKAGINTQDIQKQAHISFYLGLVYQQKRQHQSALKFYKRFLAFAKAMEDKIGMSLGANRVAINYYYNGDIAKSIAFHHQNLKLSDNQNCFAAYYNLGICHRKLFKYEEAIEYFETALQWSNQNGEAESQCITLGQLAVTFQDMELYQQALLHFEKSVDICRRLKNIKLIQSNLLNILLITSKFNLTTDSKLLDIATQAYNCSKSLQASKRLQIFSCNIGIIKGIEEFNKKIRKIQRVESQIEECELNQEEKTPVKEKGSTIRVGETKKESFLEFDIDQ